MCFELLYVIFVVVAVLNYILQDIKIYKIKNEIIEKDKLITAFEAIDKAIKKHNDGFKDHERRINDIENLLLSKKSEEPEKPDQLEYTCKDCKYYHALSGIGFTGAINFGFSNGISHFKCEKIGCAYPIECNKACQAFEKKEDLDEDENVVYANNVKIDISSKGPHIYKTDRIFMTYGDYADYIKKLYLDGGISYTDMNTVLERLKQ